MEYEFVPFSTDNHLKDYTMMIEQILKVTKTAKFMESNFSERIDLLGRNDYLNYLEYTYRKDNYTVCLVGLEKLKMANIGPNIQERKKEIAKWSGVTSINIIKVLENHITNEIILNVSVKKFEDYITLLGNWGAKAFGVGVKTYRAPMDEYLLIDRVPNSDEYNINCNKNSETIKALKLNGLVDVCRESYDKIDYKTKQKITVLKNQLKCRAVDMLYFLENQYNNIMLDMTSQEHIIYPETTRINSCANCGKLNSHNIKNCPSPTICTRCLITDHTIETCSNKSIKCINCGKPHSCNFKACWSIVNETKKNHSFIFSLILGEKVKSNPYEILNLSEYYSDTGLTEIKDSNNFDCEILSDMVHQHAQAIHERLDHHETRITTNTRQITIALEKIQKHDEILEQHKQLFIEHNENIKGLAATSTELSTKSTALLEQQALLKTSIQCITDSNVSIATMLTDIKNAVGLVLNK